MAIRIARMINQRSTVCATQYGIFAPLRQQLRSQKLGVIAHTIELNLWGDILIDQLYLKLVLLFWNTMLFFIHALCFSHEKHGLCTLSITAHHNTIDDFVKPPNTRLHTASRGYENSIVSCLFLVLIFDNLHKALWTAQLKKSSETSNLRILVSF